MVAGRDDHQPIWLALSICIDAICSMRFVLCSPLHSQTRIHRQWKVWIIKWKGPDFFSTWQTPGLKSEEALVNQVRNTESRSSDPDCCGTMQHNLMGNLPSGTYTNGVPITRLTSHPQMQTCFWFYRTCTHGEVSWSDSGIFVEQKSEGEICCHFVMRFVMHHWRNCYSFHSFGQDLPQRMVKKVNLWQSK